MNEIVSETIKRWSKGEIIPVIEHSNDYLQLKVVMEVYGYRKVQGCTQVIQATSKVNMGVSSMKLAILSANNSRIKNFYSIKITIATQSWHPL